MDVVVTVPKSFGLKQWIAEGDPVGTPWSGQQWAFYCGGAMPRITKGERVYVACEGKLRGYSPLLRLEWDGHNRSGVFIRGGNAVAVTLKQPIQGFRGWRYRFWDYKDELPFPTWYIP